MIAEGRIALNGEKLTTPATLLENLAGVTVDGKLVRPAAATRLFRFYKPQGTLTAARDPRGRTTIYDRLPQGLPRLMPVGRLDFMTEGLLLLTNDGELKRKLELPRTAAVRRYRARAFGHVTQAQLDRLAEGVTIEGVHYGSIIANLERRTGSNVWIELSLTEGKNREVRRVLAHLGLQVARLIRTAYGPFELAGLEPGEVEEVPAGELEEFRRGLR
jgi:23S rRNA pseudouridine2605 synthase